MSIKTTIVVLAFCAATSACATSEPRPLFGALKPVELTAAQKSMTGPAADFEVGQLVAASVDECNRIFNSAVVNRNVSATTLGIVGTVAGVAGGVAKAGTTKTLSALSGAASGVRTEVQKDMVGTTALELVKSVGTAEVERRAEIIRQRMVDGVYRNGGMGLALLDIQLLRSSCTTADTLALIRKRAGTASGGATPSTSPGG